MPLPFIAGLLASLGTSVTAVIAWLEARRLFLQSLLYVLGLTICLMIASVIAGVAVWVTSKVSELMNYGSSDFSFFSVANTVIPLTEMTVQIFILITARILIILASFSIAPLKYAWNVITTSSSKSKMGF